MINGEGYDENGYDLLGFDRNGRNKEGRTYEQDFEYRAAKEHERAQALLVADWKPLKSNDGYVATADGYIFIALPSPDGEGYFVYRDGEPLCDTCGGEPVALGPAALQRVLNWTNTHRAQDPPPGLVSTFFWRGLE